MMSYDNLNKIGRVEPKFPVKKITEVELNCPYKVSAFRSISTQWGDAVLVLLNEEFEFWLPKRLSKRLLIEKPEEYVAVQTDAARGVLLLRFLPGKYKLLQLEVMDKPNH